MKRKTVILWRYRILNEPLDSLKNKQDINLLKQTLDTSNLLNLVTDLIPPHLFSSLSSAAWAASNVCVSLSHWLTVYSVSPVFADRYRRSQTRNQLFCTKVTQISRETIHNTKEPTNNYDLVSQETPLPPKINSNSKFYSSSQQWI